MTDPWTICLFIRYKTHNNNNFEIYVEQMKDCVSFWYFWLEIHVLKNIVCQILNVKILMLEANF